MLFKLLNGMKNFDKISFHNSIFFSSFVNISHELLFFNFSIAYYYLVFFDSKVFIIYD